MRTFELAASGSDTDAKMHEKEAEKFQNSMQEMNEFANSVKDHDGGYSCKIGFNRTGQFGCYTEHLACLKKIRVLPMVVSIGGGLLAESFFDSADDRLRR